MNAAMLISKSVCQYSHWLLSYELLTNFGNTDELRAEIGNRYEWSTVFHLKFKYGLT